MCSDLGSISGRSQGGKNGRGGVAFLAMRLRQLNGDGNNRSSHKQKGGKRKQNERGGGEARANSVRIESWWPRAAGVVVDCREVGLNWAFLKVEGRKKLKKDEERGRRKEESFLVDAWEMLLGFQAPKPRSASSWRLPRLCVCLSGLRFPA